MTRQRPMWHDAYDAQMGLWRWYRTPASHEWLMGLFRDGMNAVLPANRPSMAKMYDAELGRLIDCDPIYVSADMGAVVQHAKDSFAPEPLIESDLPTPRGFVYFAEPVTIHDKFGNDMTVRAFAWSHQFSTTFDIDDEERVRALTERMGGELAWTTYGPRFTATEVDALVAEGWLEPYGVNVGLYADPQPYLDVAFARMYADGTHDPVKLASLRAEEDERTRMTPLVPVHLAPWHYGMTFEGNDIDPYGEPTGADQWWRLVQTTLRLMQQKIAHKDFATPHRAQRREATRLGFPGHETEVVIVRLRHEQTEPHDPTGEPANYSHRFIVGGHWRNQWYPSEQLHRQLYIAPYVKGPEDKPLIVRPRRVFQWTR